MISLSFKSDSATKTIAVIGGGFCGTASVLQLLRKTIQLSHGGSFPAANLNAVWFDKNNAFGRGLAFATDGDTCILNTPAYLMSPFVEEPNLYSDWLAVKAPQYNDISFTPRSMCGVFFQETAARYELQFREYGGIITRMHAEVTDVTSEAAGFRLTLRDSDQSVPCDAIVLCPGHRRTDVFESLSGTAGYVSNPYDIGEFRKALNQRGGSPAKYAFVFLNNLTVAPDGAI